MRGETCKNPKCKDYMTRRGVLPLCVSCRYVGRWFFAAGAAAFGVVWGALKLFL